MHSQTIDIILELSSPYEHRTKRHSGYCWTYNARQLVASEEHNIGDAAFATFRNPRDLRAMYDDAAEKTAHLVDNNGVIRPEWLDNLGPYEIQ